MSARQSIVHVAAAIICRNNQFLISHRLKHLHQGGLWEFPGGKIEAHETSEQALYRELQEELNIQVKTAKELFCIQHKYADKQVTLHIWQVTEFDGKEQGMEDQQLRWVKLSELENYEFPEANRVIIEYLMAGGAALNRPTLKR